MWGKVHWQQGEEVGVESIWLLNGIQEIEENHVEGLHNDGKII